MFSRGNKLWLCLSFHALPLEVLLFTRPLQSGAPDTNPEVRRPGHSADSEPPELGASDDAAEAHHNGHHLHTEPLGAGAANHAVASRRIDQHPGRESFGGDASDQIWEKPVAVLEKQRVLLANAAAAGLGVKPGQSATTARTLAEGIRLLERDRAAEQRCLEQLCCWAYSLTPTLYPWREDSLLLEIGSCMRLHGSVDALYARIHSQLSCRGFSYCCALAPTPKAAFLFTRPLLSTKPLTGNARDATVEGRHHPRSHPTEPLTGNAGDATVEGRHHRRSHPTEPLTGNAGDATVEGRHHRRGRTGGTSPSSEAGSLEAQLAPLPLHLLEAFTREVDALARAGLWTFGDVLSLPRRALARRCGKDFIHFLDQLLGTAEDLAPDFSPPQQFSDDYWFGYEIEANQELLPAIQRLLESLCLFLRNTQLQTRQVQWALYDINRKVQRLTVHSSQPQTNWQEWYQLTRLRIERLQLEAGIEGIGLYCHTLTPGNDSTGDLFQQAGQREPLHSLLDRLKSRLGLQSVQKIACRDEHLPEFAGYCSPDTRPVAMAASEQAPRPFWLMPEPQRLQEIAGHPCWNGRLTLVEGPERIEDNWWDQAASRDYYTARDKNGQQYWIFQDRLRGHWYIQGVFH